ncbi:hypothetical protein GCM10010975_31850 [Comamonas phosphati]|nr:hypothetical protein GCM10010975_31850 [Comamonas phosphati]
MRLEAAIALIALAAALWLRPWRMLAGRPGPGGKDDPSASPLLTPLLGVLVLLPWVWALPTLHNEDLSRLARWLMAWSDGVITDVLTAVFVVFRPQWMATWSDAIYLRQPPQA